MIVSLAPGETLTVLFHDGFKDDTNDLSVLDGSFRVAFVPATSDTEGVIRVEAELPDSFGRNGVIYETLFGRHFSDVGVEEKIPLDDKRPIDPV